MAILPDCPGVIVEIVSGGRALYEYDDDNPDAMPPKTIVKYVMVEDDSDFAVRYRFGNAFNGPHGVRTSVRLDGTKISCRVVRKKKLSHDREHIISSASSKVRGRKYKQQLGFSKIVVVKDSGQKLTKELKQALISTGEVVVEMTFVKNLQRRGLRRQGFKKLEPPSRVPEKAISAKALSHTGKLGAPVKHRSRHYAFQYVNGHDEPFARFVFKYRSLRSLKDLGIVPRTPSPTPAPPPRPAPVQASLGGSANALGSSWVNLDREDLEALLNHYTGNMNAARWEGMERDEMEILLAHHRRKNTKSAAVNVKRERAHGIGFDEGDSDIVVLEQRPAKKRCFPKCGQEVIDLD